MTLKPIDSFNPICKSLEDRDRIVKNMVDFKAGKSLLLADMTRPGAVAHINGWNIARGDTNAEFIIEPTILEAMQGKDTIAFVNEDYET